MTYYPTSEDKYKDIRFGSNYSHLVFGPKSLDPVVMNTSRFTLKIVEDEVEEYDGIAKLVYKYAKLLYHSKVYKELDYFNKMIAIYRNVCKKFGKKFIFLVIYRFKGRATLGVKLSNHVAVFTTTYSENELELKYLEYYKMRYLKYKRARNMKLRRKLCKWHRKRQLILIGYRNRFNSLERSLQYMRFYKPSKHDKKF